MKGAPLLLLVVACASGLLSCKGGGNFQPNAPAQIVRPDLAVDAMYAEEDESGVGVTVHFKVANRGGRVSNIVWRIREGGVDIATGTVAASDSGISDGEGISVVYFVTATTGLHSYLIEVDPENLILESNETNNGRIIEIEIPPSATQAG